MKSHRYELSRGTNICSLSEGSFLTRIYMLKVNNKNTKKGVKYVNPNMGGVGGNFTLHPPCWISLNNSETVKAVTLAFCSF